MGRRYLEDPETVEQAQERRAQASESTERTEAPPEDQAGFLALDEGADEVWQEFVRARGLIV